MSEQALDKKTPIAALYLQNVCEQPCTGGMLPVQHVKRDQSLAARGLGLAPAGRVQLWHGALSASA